MFGLEVMKTLRWTCELGLIKTSLFFVGQMFCQNITLAGQTLSKAHRKEAQKDPEFDKKSYKFQSLRGHTTHPLIEQTDHAPSIILKTMPHTLSWPRYRRARGTQIRTSGTFEHYHADKTWKNLSLAFKLLSISTIPPPLSDFSHSCSPSPPHFLSCSHLSSWLCLKISSKTNRVVFTSQLFPQTFEQVGHHVGKISSLSLIQKQHACDIWQQHTGRTRHRGNKKRMDEDIKQDNTPRKPN